ncbi:MAG: glycoside hydrolase family 2 protein [Bacteroidales bacterium]|nr:glycoside hydrolase family 2 protein [Bacteroidales bacterium]
MKRVFLITIALFVALSAVEAQTRAQMTLEKGWRFTREDDPRSSEVNYNDSEWQTVRVPHDWAIYGPFDKNNDIHRMAIVQDGQTTAIEHYGRTGGLPFTGVGWYRNSFSIPNFTPGKKVTVQFDGAMSNARVYINGKEAGYWPNGYNTFYFDITDLVNEDGQNNTLAVRLENFEEQSRWYPGAGLYRNVHVITTHASHIPLWGTYVTTPEVNDRFARVNVRTKVVAPGEGSYKLVTEIVDGTSHVVATDEAELTPYDLGELSRDLIVEAPLLWDVLQPNLYQVNSKLYEDGVLVDEYTTPFGIRTIEIVADVGFLINGRLVKFQGACMHHDLGPLGGAVNEAAIRRQIRIMQDMGVNAIRTSHNMPAPEYVRIADEMGMMLMVETFDEWAIPKVKNGYNRYFDEWAERDMVNVLHHFRNNPSVVMWCIGNEVEEQSHKEGAKVARFLQDICHREDPTRPVTNGMDRPDHVFSNYMAAIMEVPGFNYRSFRYQEAYEKLPQQVVLGTETTSALSSRGVYKFPVERKAMAMYDDHQASSYDVEHAGWSNLPEDDFIQHDDLHYTMGEFIWTGFDYLGEPTPYYSAWPSHSSLFGAVDLAGIPKDRFYLYRSHWNKEAETLHILPHWNWEGREGEVTPVFVYTNYPSAELFINGKSQGVRTKDLTVPLDGSYTAEAQQGFDRQKRYRLMWMDTRYEPGTVKVVAYDEDGNAVAEKEIRTAGKPHRLVLEADRTTIEADGKDLSFITVSVVDRDGNPCPNVNELVRFNVKGAGTYRAGANGDATSLDLFHLPQMHLFNGKLVAIVESGETPGTITLEATSRGLRKANITIRTK